MLTLGLAEGRVGRKAMAEIGGALVAVARHSLTGRRWRG
jgi:hypothetical protein